MSEDIIEEMRDRLDKLERVVEMLCAKSGHAFSETHIWESCYHVRVQRQVVERGSDHTQKCEICNTFKCQAED